VGTRSKAVLAERRKALEMLEELERARAGCVLRLEAIEAALDTACLALQQAPLDRSVPFEESVLRELDAEVMAVAEVTRELGGLAQPR
jgi:hypothetical protein